jgi:hypothetical protein
VLQHDSHITLPDAHNPTSLLSNVIKGDVKDGRAESITNGLYLPMPLGIDPINIQVACNCLQTDYPVLPPSSFNTTSATPASRVDSALIRETLPFFRVRPRHPHRCCSIE